jgi:hypothetical protein
MMMILLIYLLGAIITFLLVMWFSYDSGKITLGDIRMGIWFGILSWMSVVIFIFIFLQEVDGNTVVWEKRMKKKEDVENKRES